MLALLFLVLLLANAYKLDWVNIEKSLHGHINEEIDQIVKKQQQKLFKELNIPIGEHVKTEHVKTEHVKTETEEIEEPDFRSFKLRKARVDFCKISECDSSQLGKKRSLTQKHLDTSPTTQQRTLILVQNSSVTNVSTITTLWDNNHTRAIKYGRGMYTNVSAKFLDKQGVAFYARTFCNCFNYTGGTWVDNLSLLGVPVGLGGYVSKCGGTLSYLNVSNIGNATGVLIQYLIGVDDTDPNHPIYGYVVVYDSANLVRGIGAGWRVVAVGILAIVLPSANGLLTPSGVVFTGNVFGFADYNLVRLAAKNWGNPVNREIIRVATPFTSKQIGNTQWSGLVTPPISENLSPLRVYDECCQVGIGAITTTYANATFSTGRPLRKYNIFTVIFPPSKAIIN
jgi:hypothetical protein